jgi:hypothetical protein
MSAVHPLPASTSLRDLLLGAIADLAPPDTGSAPLRDLAARAQASGCANGHWASCVARTLRSPPPEDESIVFIAGELGLSVLEQLTVALLVAIDLEPLLGRVLAELQHPIAGSRPSLGFLGVALAPMQPGATAIDELTMGNAVASGLLTLSRDDRPLSERVLALPTPISLALRGHDGGWPGATIGRSALVPVALPPSFVEEAERHAQALLGTKRCLVIRCSSAAEGRAVAATVADLLRRRPVFLDGEAIDGLGPWLLLRELTPIFCFELGPGERKRLPRLAHLHGPMIVVTGLEGSVDTGSSAALDWVLGVPAPPERVELWAAALGGRELAAVLATEHRHGAGRIAHLGRLARHQMQLTNAERPSREHVRAVSWIDEGLGLASLAQPLREPVDDDALVTTPNLRAELEHLVLRCRARDGLEEHLGASLRARYRPGVRALFVGASGTGKTLAAGWLATRLGAPLYRVDLAAVTSKYIGETEKNLAQLLGRAEHADVVLLFDEADSMFGQRTEIRDANDRFANAQTNYLLQRLESFDGITILTSNSRARFDNAFFRRLDAILDFSPPGPEQRRELWLSHLGKHHKLSSRSINKLAATTDLAGGHIRNVVLTAAVQARSQGRAIEYGDVLVGLGMELRKLGKPVPQELRGEG